MKQQIIKYNHGVGPEAQNESCEDTIHPEKDNAEPETFWLFYSYPFMPLMDYSPLINEIKKAIKRWIERMGTTKY